MCRFWITSDAVLVRGIFVYEREDFLRPDRVDDELCCGKEQASPEVSVHIKSASDTKFTANAQVSRRVTQKPHLTRDSALKLVLQPLVVARHEDPFPPITDGCHSEQPRAEEKTSRPRSIRRPVTDA